MKDLIQKHENLEGETNKLKGGTLKNYVTTAKYLGNFMLDYFKKEDVDLLMFDYEAILELERHIRTKPLKKHDPCKGNGLFKHMERVNKMMGMAKDMKWIKDSPFDPYIPDRKKVIRERLTLAYFVRIENLKFDDPKLTLVKDLFVFDCYIGASCVDLMNLNETHFEVSGEHLLCTLYRQKSTELAAIPVPPIAREIMAKYSNTPAALSRGKIFPYISNQDFNRYLKVIASAANIPIHLDTKKARAFFARELNLKNGVPLETVSKMMGHAKLATTKEVYADVDEEKILEDTAQVQQRFAAKKQQFLGVA
ncbi:site-specific integrase [Filimonas effusa]|uniref:Site-specific integrase n=1 Tax=Filimonas effusa TaxID=2508721 RepID=A0A4Q1D9Z2_9BACT|nr:site-specific integrase [Filimonas effusa]RXK86187.1 site-specific integrase [Filimonas effusa]